MLDILEDEKRGDTKSALLKMHPEYSMTWVYKSKNTLFPRVNVNKSTDIQDVYTIKDREYDIKNIVSKDNIVIVEMVESYTDPETNQIYRTPEVIVLEIKDGKILRGRHYCDPAVSHLHLEKEEISKIFG